MNRKHLFLMLAAVLISGISVDAENAWSLDSCIQYAISHNIQLKKNKISLQEAQENLAQSKEQLFPSLSFSSNHNVRYQPNMAGGSQLSSDGTKIIEAIGNTSYSGSYGINAGMTLWNGGRNIKNIKLQELNQEMAGLNVEQQENSLQENIAQLYVQILYATESIKVNESTLETARQQLERAKMLFQVGNLAKSDVAQMEAQVNSDTYQLVSAQAQLQTYKLQLKQLLELNEFSEMDIVLPDLSDELALYPLPDIQSVYQAAIQSRPEIQSGRLNLESSELSIGIAKAAFQPSVNLSAGAGTSSSDFADFRYEVKNNLNCSAGLSFSMPIYNNRQVRTNIQKARLQKENSELDLQDRQKTLYSTIEQLWLDAHSAQQKFLAAQSKVASAEQSLALINEQFNLGLKNTIELLTEKSNLLGARQDFLQAKYTAILDAQLLRFYQGEDILF